MFKKGKEWDIECKETNGLTFSQLLPQEYQPVVDILRLEGFTQPSPIQAEAIKYGIEGKSIIAQSKSGTGKTLSFLTLMFCKLKPGFGLQCIIVSPTRELSNQIFNVASSLNKRLPREKQLNLALLIGGLPIKDDLQVIHTNPDVVIGTVGRVALHFNNESLTVSNIRLAIIDEADVLIKGKDFRALFGRIRHERAKRPLQVCCYSATFNRTNFAKYTRYLYPCIRINNKCVVRERNQGSLQITSDKMQEEFCENNELELEHEEQKEVGQKARCFRGQKIRQSLNVDELSQYAIILEEPEDRSLSLVKMDWIIKILKSVKFEQCIIFYNDKGRGDQIVAELK